MFTGRDASILPAYLACPVATLDGGLKAAAKAFRVKIFEPAV